MSKQLRSCELSVVIPVLDEESNIIEIHRRVSEVLNGIVASYEIVFVDDGSNDRTWLLVAELSLNDERVRGIRFSRNFGHQMAFTAGLDHARGRAVVIMDADLQDPPEVIPELIARWREGYEVVYAVRAKREGESAFKRSTAAVFYRLLNRVVQLRIPVDTGDFRLMGSKAVEAYRRLREHHRFTRGLVSWLGFKQTGVLYARQPRRSGVTKYRLRKMLRFSGDAVASFSYIPLQLATWFGVFVVIGSLAGIVTGLVLGLTGHGWPRFLLMGSALALVAGVQLLGLGMIGEYLGRVYDEVRARPLYLVQELIGGESETSVSPTNDTVDS